MITKGIRIRIECMLHVFHILIEFKKVTIWILEAILDISLFLLFILINCFWRNKLIKNEYPKKPVFSTLTIEYFMQNIKFFLYWKFTP